MEWETLGADRDSRLRGRVLPRDPETRSLLDALRDRIDIKERFDGLEISTTSYVGRVDVGSLRIVVRPKLDAMPLARLLRYAYGLRDLSLVEETVSPLAHHGLQDLLIVLLASEVEELIRRGLPRRYASVSEELESPRGRILFDRLAKQGGVVEAHLPCRHDFRQSNWHLNRVLRAGLDHSTRLTDDRDLRRRLHRLASVLEGVTPVERLDLRELDRAERELTRMTAASQPALTIIRLLLQQLGVSTESSESASPIPGFLFDMNMFFQRLVSRFLREHLVDHRIVDEAPLRSLFAYSKDANPRRQRAPTPRPDYTLYSGNDRRAFLDAKYRDIWSRGLPAEWLYQLSVYALASPSGVSVLLYATTAKNASDERIDVHPPFVAQESRPTAVIIRPVVVARLDDVLRSGSNSADPTRRRLAKELVSTEVLRSTWPGAGTASDPSSWRVGPMLVRPRV